MKVKQLKCTECKKKKPFYRFHVKIANANGRANRCSACVNAVKLASARRERTEVEKTSKPMPMRIGDLKGFLY